MCRDSVGSGYSFHRFAQLRGKLYSQVYYLLLAPMVGGFLHGTS